MMKLNGNVYLSYNDVEHELTNQLSRFSTSQHVTPPGGIPYIDSEFVVMTRRRVHEVIISLGFLYRTENCVGIDEIVGLLSSFFYDDGACDSSLSFLTTQLTSSQRSVHRTKYYHYLFNIISGEVINALISKFV